MTTTNDPPIPMIYMPSRLPPEPRRVWAVRTFLEETGCILHPDADPQAGLFWCRNSQLYPYTPAGWDLCLALVERYKALKAEIEKTIGSQLKKLAKVKK